nr:IucA/IucC family protein [Coxiella-like endosymbiont]
MNTHLLKNIIGYYPIYPWQYRNELNKFKRLILKNKILTLHFPSLTVTPTLSFRTVIPIGKSPKSHIKLPIGIRITSAMRIVSPGTSRMSPRVEKLLSQMILKRENYFSQSLYLCKDILGVYLQAPEYDYNNQHHFRILIHKNPLTLIKNSEIITLVATLFSPSPRLI